jgi:magnesium chelatase accessory protein
MSLSARPPDLDIEGRNWPFRDHSRHGRFGRDGLARAGAGRSEAPVALLVHGAGAAGHSFRGLMPLLSGPSRHRNRSARSRLHPRRKGCRSDAAGNGARTLPDFSSSFTSNPPSPLAIPLALRCCSKWHCRNPFAPGRIVGLNGALEPIRGNALLSPLAKAVVRQSADLAFCLVPGADGGYGGPCAEAPPVRGSMARGAIATPCCCASLLMSAARWA